MGHHTKVKGDVGVACVYADLAIHGVGIARPLSEHAPFDLIAISPDFQRLCRLSVKYRSQSVPGTVRVVLKSVWNDGRGTHIVPHDKSTYDAIAIFDPTTRDCYYVRVSEIDGLSVTLRVGVARSNQKVGIRHAADYRDPMRLFSPRAS